MARLLAAAILICASVVGLAPTAGAGWYGEPRGRGHYRRRGRGHYRPNYDNNPVPGILGGIIGGWLGSQMNREPERRNEPLEWEDDAPRDRR
jgi:hypothetical protein